MKYIISLALIICVHCSDAAVIWPGTSAPCNTTLDACADGSAIGEVIEIHTDGPIDETITSSKGISFVAGTGFRPVFTQGSHLELTGSSDSDTTITISGLTFIRGRISYLISGQNGSTTTLNISNNRIESNTYNNDAIRILHWGSTNTHQLDLNINANQINFSTNGINLERSGAIAITNGIPTGSLSSNVVSGQIYNNHINVSGDNAVGVGLYEFDENNADLDISSNTITGSNNAAILISKLSGAVGNSRVDVAHNAIYNNESDETVNGFKAVIEDGELQVNAINNSVIDAHEGFNFQQSFGGILDVNLYNNLIVSTRTSVIVRNPLTADTNGNITFTNDNNFFYANSLADPDFVVGPNFITGNPKITSFSNARLLPGSPAIEAANQAALFLIGSVPLIDADGLYRIKNGNPNAGGIALDVGAYEAGDVRLLDVLKGTASNLNPIEDSGINEQQFAKLQVTQNWHSPNGSGLFNDANIGVWNAASSWYIFNQDPSTPMDSGTAYNVWNPAPSTHNFVHTATDASPNNDATTALDMTGLNNNPDAILSVTQLFGTYNDNPVGVFYNNNDSRWYIYNSNLADMPENAQFNVYYQDSSANAFVHSAKAANISGNGTYIDHPLLDNTPCAQFQVTQLGISNYPYRIGVFYDPISNRWSIFNQGAETMPDYARFHVIVSADQIAQCSDIIFKNDFE